MDRLTQLRGEAGGSGDSTLDSSASPSEAYMTANESSKYFSLTEDDSSFDISPIKDVSLASTVEPEKAIAGEDQLMSDLTPIAKERDLLEGYKFGKQIEAANILSGGVNIFDDNDNSYDGDELVIDDNADIEDKTNSELKLIENTDLPFQKPEEMAEGLDSDSTIGSKDTEVVLQIDGKNVNAIDIGNGLYLYRKAGEEELAAVQIVGDDHDQPTFKFLKVRENAEGNLEVYEEIEIEVPKEVPTKDEKSEKNTSHVPIKDINKVISEPASNKVAERMIPQQEMKPIASTSENEEITKAVLSENKTEINLNGKMMKYNETRKSPVIHSTPNKEGIPLTKTMVDMQLHPSRPLDKVKTIEVHTDNVKQKIPDTQTKNKDLTNDHRCDSTTNDKEIEKPKKVIGITVENKEQEQKTCDGIPTTEKQNQEKMVIQSIEHTEPKLTEHTEPTQTTAQLKINMITKKEDKSARIEQEKQIIGIKNAAEISTKSATSGIPKEDSHSENIPKDKKLIEVVQDSAISESVNQSMLSNIKNDNLGTDVKEQQEKLKPEYCEVEPDIFDKIKAADEKKDNPIKQDNKSSAGNFSRTDSETSKEKIIEVSAQPQEVSVTKEKKDIKNVITEASNKTISEKCTGKNNNITEHKVVQQPTKKIDDIKFNMNSKIQDATVFPVTSNKNESKNIELSSHQADNITPNMHVTEIKQIKQDTPCQAKMFNNKDSLIAETKLLDQGKLICSEAVKLKSVVEPKQSGITKSEPLKEPVPVKKIIPEKIASVGQESVQSTSIVKKQIESKTEFKVMPTQLPVTTVPVVSQRKPEINKIPSQPIEKKPIINNNAGVPFGQWTPVNRQEFLNKIKAKVPVNVSNTKPISKPNDLNRRDVLQKIDSQRQSSNAASKIQESAKLNIKDEIPSFINKPATTSHSKINTIMQEHKAPLKIEAQGLKNKPILIKKVEMPVIGETFHKLQSNSTVTNTYIAKSEGQNRNEFNNQHLIDKTVEGIINRAVSTKQQDPKPTRPKEPVKTHTLLASNFKSKDSKPCSIDAIEMKMNELHGIPFVERPAHELPRVYKRDIKTYAKADNLKFTSNLSQIPNLVPVTKSQQKNIKNDVIDLDSEEEIIEHEPITGDIDILNKNYTSKQSNTSAETNMAQIGSDSSKKESIITEKDFDKFVRRNSITYENCLTVNIEKNKNRNVVQGLIQKDINDKNTKKDIISETKISSPKQINHPNKILVNSKLVPVGDDAFNKNYQSKLQLAYQTALTKKRQMESPITILEDKPVKVVFMDPNTNFQASQLNVQGQDLSPTKKLPVSAEPDSVTTSTGDSLDSEVLDSIEETKPQEETKSNKTKHQRKQVLTSVETPELELIVPGDLGIEISPKKKRRTDDKADKMPRSLLPKKSYLLGRNVENPVPQDSAKDAPKQIEERKDIIISHNDTASAIDNLVKAAELIENQSGNFKSTDIPTSDVASPVTTVKRGRGRPRKYPLPDATSDSNKVPSPQKKPRLVQKDKTRASQSTSDEENSDDSFGEGIVRENWTMGKINENIVCPICNKLFRSENVVFKHVKHCTGPSPNRSDSDKRSSRRSRLSHDSKSMDSRLDDTDGETDSVISKKSAPKKRNSKELSPERKEEIIVIEDTPVKSKVEKCVEPKQHESRKPTKTKAQYKAQSALSCEHCGKTFRQLSYLVNHKQLHKKANPRNEAQVIDKSVYSCEVCKKEFRKLHHLVQHRIIHNPSSMSKPSRKSSSEQNFEHKTSKDKEKEIKQVEDQSAAFRCEPCDKSFRKLHHLVEHRETHDGINRQKGTPTTQTTEKVIQNLPPPPQCDVCKKSFRKLHHLIEHKEQHLETSSEKSEDKNFKNALSTKDIIHECSLCYMVFPNEHSLNKHSVFCQKKKRSTKQSKELEESVTVEGNETPNEKENVTLEPILVKSDEITDVSESPKNMVENTVNDPMDINKTDDSTEIKDKQLSKDKEEEKVLELPNISNNKDEPEESKSSSVKVIKDTSLEILQKVEKLEEKAEMKLTNTTEIIKKKTPIKGVSAAKRRKSNLPLAQIKETALLESSDDDDVRYMLNPDYNAGPVKAQVGDTSEVKLFMKVKAKKRNSLQFERPNSKELVKRRISLQHPLKIPRLKRVTTETNYSSVPTQPDISKTNKVENTDSDDSDVKYSFPEEVLKATESVKSPKEKRKTQTEKVQNVMESKMTPKEKRKSLAEKRKLLSGIARRKSSGKQTLIKHKERTSPVKEIKRRRAEVEHRCDCGQLFSSAALLSRHTTLAHTPPRVRRRRTATPPPAPSPPPASPARKPTNHKAAESRKSSVRSDIDNTASPKTKPGRPPGKTNARTPVRKSLKAQPTRTSSGFQSSRKLAAHRGVPVPEKMKKAMEKLKQ